MSKPPRPYTCLSRPFALLAGRSLWLGADHLLLVSSNGTMETYQRLALRDIQGFFVIGSRRRLFFGLPWLCILAISGLALLVSLADGSGPVTSPWFFSIALLAFGWNQFLGAGCRIFVVTGVQTTALPLVRRRRARQTLSRLEVLIDAAQADLVTPPVLAAAPAAAASTPPPS